jgi:hypothetical protein
MSAGLRRHSALRPGSQIIITPADGSREGQADLVRCVHCGRHWPVGASIGLMMQRKLELGFCWKCCGITCPGERCSVCTPVELQLEEMERGRD